MKEIWDTKKGGTENIINKMTEETILPQSREKGIYHEERNIQNFEKTGPEKKFPITSNQNIKYIRLRKDTKSSKEKRPSRM